MTWQQLDLWPVPRARAEALSALLFMVGAGSVEEVDAPGHPSAPPQQPWDTAPAPEPPSLLGLRAWFDAPHTDEIEATLGPQLQGIERRWCPVRDADWEQESRDAFPPVQLTPTLRVAPPWFAQPGDLIIDPGSGFGTGQHPTTQAAMALLEDVIAAHPGATLLDVGCGSGVLAIAAARAGCDCVGTDIDPDALDNAAHNAHLNQVSATWSSEPLHHLPTPFDLVVANIHAEALVQLAPQLIRLARAHLILSGVLASKLDAVQRAFASLPPPVVVERDEWRALRYDVPPNLR